MTDTALLDEWTTYTRDMAKVGTDEVFNLLLVPFTCGIHLIALVKSSIGVEDTRHKRKIVEGVRASYKVADGFGGGFEGGGEGWIDNGGGYGDVMSLRIDHS